MACASGGGEGGWKLRNTVHLWCSKARRSQDKVENGGGGETGRQALYVYSVYREVFVSFEVFLVFSVYIGEDDSGKVDPTSQSTNDR